jgi:hypothetical protein
MPTKIVKSALSFHKVAVLDAKLAKKKQEGQKEGSKHDVGSSKEKDKKSSLNYEISLLLV